MPGLTVDARCATTASAIEEVTARRSPKTFAAHRMISVAGASSSSRPAHNASASVPEARRASRLRAGADPGATLGSTTALVNLTPPSRETSTRMHADNFRTTTDHGAPAAAGPPLRSMGSGKERPVRSREICLVGPRGPRGEGFLALALRQESVQHPLDVVLELRGGDLEPAHLASEPRGQAEAAAQVHLVAL